MGTALWRSLFLHSPSALCIQYRMKGKVIGIIALALGVIAAFVCCFGVIAHTASCDRGGVRVVLDAGHGGIDGGVQGRETKCKESDINLAVVFYLQEELKSAGVEVTLTRSSEAGLYGTTAKYFKKRDMEKRRQIIERAAPALVVSVHQNFFANRSKRGANVFYKRGDGSGEALASSILNEFRGKEGTPQTRAPLLGDYYMLNCTAYPSVIVECAFLSNPDDEALLVSEEYRREIARRISRGILSFLMQ